MQMLVWGVDRKLFPPCTQSCSHSKKKPKKNISIRPQSRSLAMMSPRKDLTKEAVSGA